MHRYVNQLWYKHVVKLTQITEFLGDKLIENAQFIPRAF